MSGLCPAQFPGNALVHRPVLLEHITGDRIASNAQLDGALEHLGALGAQPLDAAAFESAAGVGVVVRFKKGSSSFQCFPLGAVAMGAIDGATGCPGYRQEMRVRRLHLRLSANLLSQCRWSCSCR